MKYFFDTEFTTTGRGMPNQLISIGVVREDGESWYRENIGWDPRTGGDWIQQNVRPHLIGEKVHSTKISMAQDLRQWTKEDDDVQFWAHCGAFDWVFMCEIFGGFLELPDNWNRAFNELKQFAQFFGIAREFWPKQTGTEHNALADAQWNLEVYNFIVSTVWYGVPVNVQLGEN